MKWIGKTWAVFYKIRMIDRASGYVDPDEDFQLDEEDDEDIDEEVSEPESVGISQVPFLMCTLETPQKYCSTSSLLLTFC